MATDYDKEIADIQDDLDLLHESKVDAVKGKQLSTNDFTEEHLRKVNRIETKEYQQEIVSGVTKDLQQTNANHIRLADAFHRHLRGQDGADAKFKKDVEDNLRHMGNLVKSANDRMNEIWQNWDELIKEDQNHEIRIQQLEGKTLNHDALIDNNTGAIVNIQGEQVVQNAQIKEMQDKNVELETRVVDVEVSDADQNHRLDIAENRIGTFTDRMTALEDGYAQRDARMDGLDAQVSRYTERMLALELSEKAQNDRLKAEEEKNKRQDIDIACLYAEAKDRMITIDTEGTAIELQNSREGFVVTNSIEGNTKVNCNKDVDKEVTLLTSVVDVSADNNVTLTEGVVDDGLVDVYLEGNTLVNVSKTKDVTPITHESEDVTGNHIALADEGSIRPVLNGNTLVNVCDQKDPVAVTKSYTVETGNHVALQGEYDGKCRPVVTGNTLVNVTNGIWSAAGESKYVINNVEKGYGVTSTSTGSLVVTKKSTLLKDNTTYTLIFDINSNLQSMRYSFFDGSTYTQGMVSDDGADYSNGYTRKMVVLTTTTLCKAIVIGSHKDFELSESYLNIKNLVVLEGDYTNKPIPEYFEGLQSSFEDKVVPENLVGEILSTNGDIQINYGLKGSLVVGSTYTLVLDISQSSSGDIWAGFLDSSWTSWKGQVTGLHSGLNLVNITPQEGRSNVLRVGSQSSFVLNVCYLIEGDYTNYDFSDYDPTKVGKYKVDYVVTGKNKFPNKSDMWTVGTFHEEDGYLNSASGLCRAYIDFIPVNPGTAYTFSNANTSVNFRVFYYGENKYKSYLGNQLVNTSMGDIVFTTPKGCKFIRFHVDSATTDLSIQIEEGTVATSYEPYKEYKKTLYLNSPLLEGDTIEQQGDNVVHVHRYRKIVLDGGEYIGWDIGNMSLASENLIEFVARLSDGTIPLVCSSDKINTTLDTGSEGIHTVNTTYNLRIIINKSKLSTQDVAGFKQYLQQNPTTVVYKLATPQYEVISQNDTILCDSYTNGHLDVDSVVPIERVSFRGIGMNLRYLYPSTEYTIQFEADSKGKFNYIAIGDNSTSANINITKGINKVDITTLDTIKANYLYFNGIGFNASNIVVTPAIEQDFDYFSGMQSCFEDNLITEGENAGKYKVDYKVTGKNKFDGVWESGTIIATGGLKDNPDEIRTVNYIRVHPNQVLRFSTPFSNALAVKMYDKNKKYLGGAELFNLENGTIYNGSIRTVPANVYYLKFKAITTDLNLRLQIEEGTQATPYEPYKEYTKTLYLNSPLLEGDTIEEKDGNIYHVHRYGKVVLEGSEEWVHNNSEEDEKYILFKCRNEKFANSGYSKVYSAEYSWAGNAGVFNRENIINAHYNYYNIEVCILKSKLNNVSVDGFKAWLRANNIEFIAKLSAPQYELIQQGTIAMPAYSAGHLDVTTAVPVDKVNFLHFEEELTYLYPATSYTVQFTSDKAITADIKLGGTSLLAQSIVTGLNRITMTTPSELVDSKLVIDGAGAKISEVVVTDTAKGFGYFEGMKSVGECEDLEIISYTNLIDINSFTLHGNEISCNNGVLTFDNPSYYGNYADYYTEFKYRYGQLYTMSCNFSRGYAFFQIQCGDSERKVIADFRSDIKTSTTFVFPTNTKYVRFRIANGGEVSSFTASNIQLIPGTKVNASYIPYQLTTQTLTHEPLRGIGEIKDKYVLIDGKWYIERNCAEVVLGGNSTIRKETDGNNVYRFITPVGNIEQSYISPLHSNNFKSNSTCLGVDYECIASSNTHIYFGIAKNRLLDNTVDSFKLWLQTNPTTVVYQLLKPTYEPLEYNPFEVYSEITHVSTNSTIPCNVTVKNHGYNCILKPSTTYTVVSNQGVQNMTTPATLGDSLRFSGNGVLKDVMILEGTLSDNQIPGFFAGMESCFEQHKITDEYDEHFGYYEVSITVRNEDDTKESSIKFYIKDPLRGIEDIKDKVFVEDGKVKILRNCGQREYVEGDFETYVTDKVDTVYPLEEPFIEEVDYHGIRLSQVIWENSTMFFDTNIPSTANISYSVTVPMLDQVAEVSSVTDDQDALIIDMATQVAVLSMTM